jgi:hypothetical protein
MAPALASMGESRGKYPEPLDAAEDAAGPLADGSASVLLLAAGS